MKIFGEINLQNQSFHKRKIILFTLLHRILKIIVRIQIEVEELRHA